MVDIFGVDRRAFIGRELTKIHEQCVQETLGELRRMIDDKSIVSKGEFVVVVDGSAKPEESPLEIDRLLRALSTHLSAKDAARVAAEASGQKRNALYERLLQLKGS